MRWLIDDSEEPQYIGLQGYVQRKLPKNSGSMVANNTGDLYIDLLIDPSIDLLTDLYIQLLINL